MNVHVEINPVGADREYLESLNACFGRWGDQAQLDWVFRRAVGSHPPDRMIVRDPAGELLAGSGVSYRRVQAGKLTLEVGIMTGSWTLPAARGKGCFSRIVEDSRRLSAEHGCALLVAFVTEDNASRRRLEGAGAHMLPSRYFFAGDGQRAEGSLPVRPSRVGEEELWRRVERSRGEAVHFVYPTLEDFRGQCLLRPHPVELRDVGRAVVVLERTAAADRLVVADLAGETVEAVFGSLAAEARRNDRGFFGFAMGSPTVEGLGHKDGFLTLMVASQAAMAGATLESLADWHIDAGDRM